jgi:NADPH-dependent curcumin reductase CurA
MTTLTNQQFRLATRPTGLPGPETWELTEEPVAEPEDGQVVVQVLYTSLDPAMRVWLNEGDSYVPAVQIGEVMRAIGVGRVITSAHPELKEGDHVSGIFGIQRYAVLPAGHLTRLRDDGVPLPAHLNALGIPGMTAYFGLLDIGRPQPGETVAVSAAAGSVGSLVGQIARIRGCRAVGIAGGAEKCRLLTEEYGFDAAVDYRAGGVAGALREHCPHGIDVFFDNVGGDVLEAALRNLARGARVVLCGAISQYNEGAQHGPRNYMALLIRRARMEGFVVFDYADRYAEAAAEIAGWMSSGALVTREHIVDGLETFPESLLMLYRGENTGKLMLRVGEE